MSSNNPFAIEQANQRQPASGAIAKATSAKAVAEVQAALLVAKNFPRDQRAAMDRILLACARPGLAERAIYQYSRGGSDVTGPSIRLAEAIAQSWGNVTYGVEEVDSESGESTVKAYAWDLETNTRREVVFQVPHERHTKKGVTKLTDPRDIYELVANQGARRVRACILGLIPGDVIEAAVAECDATMKTTEQVTPDRIGKLLQAFAGYNVTKAQIEARIQRRVDALTPALMVGLRKIYNSLRDGMSTAAEWFDAEVEAEAKPVKAADRAAAILSAAKPAQVVEPRSAVEQAPRPLPVEAPTGKTSAQIDRELADEIGEAP